MNEPMTLPLPLGSVVVYFSYNNIDRPKCNTNPFIIIFCGSFKVNLCVAHYFIY